MGQAVLLTLSLPSFYPAIPWQFPCLGCLLQLHVRRRHRSKQGIKFRLDSYSVFEMQKHPILAGKYAPFFLATCTF